MKLHIVIITGLLLISTAFPSCKKSYLNRDPKDALPFDKAIVTEEDLSSALNGIYSMMRSSSLYGRSLPMIGDIMADNVYISSSNSGRYVAFNNYALIPSSGEVNGIWTDAYRCILRTNQAISADVEETSTARQLKGEAYAARALMYFELVRLFAKPYSATNAGSDGVPIVLNYDITALPKRSTVQQVYNQVLSDLNNASTLMSIDKNSEYLSRWAVEGLLAKVYLFTGDWLKAKQHALDVVTNGGYALVDSADFVDFWNNPEASTKSETLFEVSSDQINNNGYDALSAMYDPEGYGDALCDSDFYHLYSPADVRSQLLIEGERAGDPAVIVVKYPNLVNGNDDNSKVLRLAEVYLILAEAYYRLSDETNARLNLNLVAKKRQPGLGDYTMSGTALLDAILLERRKELAFEGARYADLNRLGKDVARSGQFPVNARLIPASDHRRILPIPLNEINANPNMKQNEGY